MSPDKPANPLELDKIMEEDPSIAININRVGEAHQELLNKFINHDLPRVMNQNHNISLKGRYFQLTQIADNTMKCVIPFTPCVNGCSHCCYQSIAITRIEAERIARFTKRKMSEPEGLRFGANLALKYKGIPCVFLENGRCTVYEVRPFVCRMHHNISDNGELCDLKETRKVPAINFGPLVKAYVTFAVRQKVADIREWFPKKS